MLLPRLMFEHFGYDNRSRTSLPIPSQKRVVTYKLNGVEVGPNYNSRGDTRPRQWEPEFIGPYYHGRELTHEELYGWDPVKDKDKQSWGVPRGSGTPKFKGYFG